MHWSDPLEKVARATLWLALAAICLLIPFAMAKQNEREERLRTLLSDAEKKLSAAMEAKNDGPKRMGVSSLGSILTSLNLLTSEGNVWFTNVSPRKGVVCIRGVVTNSTTERKTESLAACEKVEAYASVHIKVSFAGRELKELCKEGTCDFDANEMPDHDEH